MKTYGRKVLSLVLSVALLVTCCVSGLVLPASANTEATNLFPNGDFEGFGESTPVVAPWTAHNSNANWTIREGAGVDGSWGLELTGSSNSSYVKFATKPTFEDGATYRLAWRAKVDPARKGGANAGYVQLYTTTGLTYVNQSTAATYLKASTVTGEWISYYVDFTAAEVDGKVPSIDSSWGMIVAGVAAGVCFDDFTLTKIADNTEREILMDGDFEKGADSSLFGSSVNEAYTTLSREEVGYIGVDPDDANNRVMVFKSSENGWTSAYFRALHANAGKSYVLAFDYKGGGFSMFSNAVYSNYNDNAAQTVAFEAKDAWTHVEVKINSLTDAKQWFTSFEKRNGNQTANTYIDNMSLKEYKEIVLTGVALNKATATIKAGKTVTLTATAKPAGAALPTVEWTSSNTAVATVADGVVTGVAAGVATITAKAGEFTATCTVTVEAVNASEMFPNGDFEGFGEEPAVVAPWTAHNSATTSWTIREGAGVNGSWGLELTGAAHGTYVKFPTKPTFEDGATYRLSWRAKVDPARKGSTNAGYVQLYTTTGLTYINKSVATVYLKTSTVAGEWISYYMDFTAAEVDGKVPSIDASWGMYVRGAATGVCFDDFSLVKINDNTEREILMDGDFEKGADSSLFGSSLNESYTILTREEVGYIGADPDDADNRVMVLKSSENGWVSAYFRALHADEGKTYVLAFDYKGGGFVMFSNTVYSNYNDDAVQSLAFEAKDEWTHVEVEIHNLKEANNWLTSFEKRNGNQTANTYIDNMSLKEYKAPAVTGIQLDKTAETLDEGGSVALTVTVQPDGAPMPEIVWTSSDDTVATVANGVVTAVKAGTATITAKAGEFTATCVVTVNVAIVPATSIELSAATLELLTGETKPLTVTAKPDGAVMPEITWTSSDESVVLVQNGMVSGVKAGTATVTATANGLAPVTCEVTVESADGNIFVNGNFELGAAVAWGNSEFVQAGVGKDGSYGLKSVRAATNGDWDSGKGAYYKLPLFSVLKPNTKYTLSFDYKNEGAGQGQVQLNPMIGTTMDGKTLNNIVLKTGDVDWTAYSVQFTTPDSLTVNDGWEVTFRSYGREGYTYYDNIKLIEAPAATALVLDKTSVVVMEGKTFTLAVSTTPEFANVANAVWTSSDNTIATVENGVVKGVKEGVATITVTAGALTATCAVTVEPDDGNIIENGSFEQGANVAWGGNTCVQNGVGKNGTVGLKSERPESNGDWDSGNGGYYKLPLFSVLKPNTKYTLSFEYKNEGAGQGQVQLNPMIGTTADGKTLNNIVLKTGDVDWTAYSVQFTTPDSLTVNEGWEVTFRSYGKQGVTYYDNIKLIEAPAATAITLDKSSVVVTAGKDFTLTPSTTPAWANVADAVWTSSDNTIATVENGVVKGVKEGTATITVTAGALSASCTVVVEPDDGNIIENGNFEQGAAVAWGGSTCVQNGFGKDGSVGLRSERAEGSGAWDSGSGAYYKLPLFSVLKPNTKYTLSFEYKNEGKGQGQVQLNPMIGTTADGKTLNNIVLKTGDVDWTAYSVVFTTPESLTVSEGFEVTFRSYGEQGVTYYDNIKLIEAPAATAIALDKANAKVKEGKDFVLTLTTTPEVANVPNAVWTSSDNTVATVENGVVTGVKAGSATITVTAGELTASCTVTVEEDDGNLLENGDFEQGANVAWGGNAFVQEGVGKDGSVGIKLTTDMAEGATSHQQPTVWYKGDFVSLLEPDSVYELSVDVKHEGGGFAAHLTMMSIGTLESGKDFNGAVQLAIGDTEWQTITLRFSTPSTLPTVSKGYEWNLCQVHYAGAAGTGAAYFDNAKLIKVGTVDYADEITIAPDELELLPNESGTLKVMTTPANTATGVLTWESSDPSIATVDQKGVVTAVANSGEAIITVTNNKGKTDTAKVVVREDANLIKNGSFEQGGEYWGNNERVQAGIGKDGGYGLSLLEGSVYYKSSLAAMQPNTKYIMTFDYCITKETTWRFWSAAFGTDFKKLPKLEIDGEWHSATVIFTTPAEMPLSSGWDLAIVTDVEGMEPARLDNLCLRKYNTGVAVEKLTLSESAITIIPGRTASLTPYAEPSDGDLNDMTWTSDNHNVAIVEYGLVTGVGKGTATITATTKNGKTATCVVTVSGGDVLLKNPTFDMDETVWTLTGGAEIVDGEGRLDSAALKLVKDAVATQTITGLKPATTYQLRINARTAGGAASFKLADGDTTLFAGVSAANKTWKDTTFEFTTPDTVSGTATFTLTMLNAGPVYIDNVILNVKASLVDFVVNDLFWVGGDYQVTPGTELTFAATVVNQGADPVKAGSVVELDVCKNGEAIMTLSQTLAADLPTDGSVVLVAETPWAAEAGHWVISARANPRLSILEMNDVNNSTQKQLRVDDEILTTPEQAVDFGMTELTFSDEFDSLESIDQLASGADGYKWYVTRNWGAGTVQPDDYSIEDGVVTLKAKQAGFNITLSTIDVNTHNGFTWNKGYLEVRLRIPYADPEFEGGSPAVWSFPAGKWLDIPGETNQWVEMDWMEYWGYRDQFPGGYYTSAFHEQVQGVEGKKDHWFTNGNASLEGLGDEQWHTMGWLWVENAIIGYLDGVENFRLTYSEDDIPGQKVNVRSGDPDTFGAYSMINQQFIALFIGGGAENPMEVDYVRIWQTKGETPTLPDVPEEEETPEIEVDAFTWWYNYCTDIYGDNITEVTYDNFLTVLGAESVDGEYTTVDLWNRLSANSKAAINEMLAANGQPSFDELLADALAMAERVKGGWTPDGEEEAPQQPEGEGEGDEPNTDEPSEDEPNEDETDKDELEDDKSDEESPEANVPTGATSAWPFVAAGVLVVCIVLLFVLRKRK